MCEKNSNTLVSFFCTFVRYSNCCSVEGPESLSSSGVAAYRDVSPNQTVVISPRPEAQGSLQLCSSQNMYVIVKQILNRLLHV